MSSALIDKMRTLQTPACNACWCAGRDPYLSDDPPKPVTQEMAQSVGLWLTWHTEALAMVLHIERVQALRNYGYPA